MTTVFVAERPPVVDAWLAERRRLGQDRRDEVWEGVLHVAPYASSGHSYVEVKLSVVLDRLAMAGGLYATGSFNLGEPEDYRVPDHGVHRTRPGPLYLPTAAVVVEVLSPGDESLAKLEFYAAHGVDEMWVADPVQQAVRVWRLRGGGYDETGVSEVLGTSGPAVAAELDWP